MDESLMKKSGQVRRGKTKNSVVKVPSLPKLHCRDPLVTTKLCTPIFKSTAGHDFDLSSSIEHESVYRKYNALHDPHTKAFFHRGSMFQKLQKNGFVTGDMKVVCSLKEYSAYRDFMECESMKFRKHQEQKLEEKKAIEEAVVKVKEVNPVEKQREVMREKFFKDREKQMASRQKQMRRVQLREEQERIKTTEEKKLMRERSEIRREAVREQRRLLKLQQEHQEALEKRRQLHSSENQMQVRLLQLQQTRQRHKLDQIHELESKWQAYDEHVQKARKKEEELKTRAKEEKERKRNRRKKILELMKAKKEERWKKLHEETLHHAEDIKKEADEREKALKEKKEHEVAVWREKIHREQDHWQHHMHHQMEVCHKEHQKQMEEVLHNSYLPKCAKTNSFQKWVSGSRNSIIQHHHTQHQHPKKDDALKPKKKSVRFQQNASIHIIDEDEPEFENDTASTSQDTSEDSTPVEEDSEKSKEESKMDDGPEDAMTERVSLDSLKKVATDLAENAIQNAKDKIDTDSLNDDQN